MKKFLIGIAVMLIAIQVLMLTSPVQAKRRTVFEPHSGYCLSLVHVGNVRYCKEHGGRW